MTRDGAGMELIVFTGIPASGKTTFYARRFLNTHVRVSLDMLKTRKREEIVLFACLAAEQPVVVDNTNATREKRARYVRLARAAKFRTTLYFFEVSTREAVARNEKRTGKARVGKVAIFATAKHLQRPAADEDFDQMFLVRPGEGREFAVEAFVPT